MNELSEARQRINEIDAKIAKLFEARMEAVRDVGEYKIANGMRVFDPSREKEVIERNIVLIEDAEIRGYYPIFMQNLFAVSRKMETKMMHGARVAYCGVPGAFAFESAEKLFPEAEKLSYSDFAAAYEAVRLGDADFAVLPLENSTEGEVGQVMDLIFYGSLYINGVYDFSVKQNLLGVKGARLSDIKTVISHAQALAQTSEYIREHSYETVEASNTAVAAKKVAENADVSVAAIGSLSAAEIFGLDVIERSINHNQTNTTRFAIFSRHENPSCGNEDHSIIVFTSANEAGKLAAALEVIGRHGYNLRTLRSRPMKGVLWKYYYYAEVEGKLSSEAGKEMLLELESQCDMLKIVGTFEYTGMYVD